MRVAALFAMAATAQAQAKNCADITRDGNVNVEDLLATLAQYGTKCTVTGGGGAVTRPTPMAKAGECRDLAIGRASGGGNNLQNDGNGQDAVHSNGGQGYCANINELHEVRCVSAGSLTKSGGIYKKCQGRDQWSQSGGLPHPVTGKKGCQHGVTFNQAVKMCASIGARLPTRQEVNAQCTAGSGCGHDGDLVWTATKSLPTAKQLIANRKTCKDIAKATWQSHEFEYCVSKLEKHEVRCCSSKPVKFFRKNKCNGKDLWSESNAQTMVFGKKKGCQHALNWNQANNVCKKAGARLCTVAELRRGCTGGTGCNHDQDLIWANSNNLPVRPQLPKRQNTKVKGPAMGFEAGTIKLKNTEAARLVLKSKFKNPIIILGTPTHKGGNEVVMRVKRRGWVTNDMNEKKDMDFRPTWFDAYMDTPNHGAKVQTRRACKDFNTAGKTPAQKCSAAVKGQEKACAGLKTMYACVTRRVRVPGGGACRLNTHTTETVSYIVVEHRNGNINPANPKTMYRSGKLQAANFGWKKVTFGKTADPALKAGRVVLSQIQSHNGADWVKTRLRKSTPTGFEIKMEETGIDNNHVQEQLAWVAVPVGTGKIGANLAFESLVTPNKVTHKPYGITFKAKFKAAPMFFSAMQTTDGGDPTHMRLQSISNTKASFFVEEETCSDREIDHTTEAVGVLAIGPA